MSNEYEGMGLTADELAALAEPDGDTTLTQEELEAKAGTTQPAGEENDDDATPDDKSGKPDATVAAANAVDAPAAAGGDAAPAADAQAAAAEPSPAPQQAAPILVAQAPADAEARLEEISNKKSALDTRFDEGDITNAEYRKELDTLSKQEREIELAVSKAQIAVELEQQRQQNQWTADCNGFLAAHPQYQGDANKEVFEHLNETIIAYAKMPRNASLSGPELLAKAHKAVMAERGTPVQDAAAPVKAPRKEIPKAALPPDLGKMPAASGNEPGEGKWSSLDRMQASNPTGYEKALAQMSEADREAYMAE